MRTVVAVLAGVLTWFLAVMVGTILTTTLFVMAGIVTRQELTVQLPLGFLAANLVVSLLAAAAGGWLASRLDDPGRWRAAIGLALLVVLVSVANARAPASAIGTLTWYPWVITFLSAIGVALGGWARRSFVDFPASPRSTTPT